jgi:ABC-2 type transport system ATP-binding protein
VATLLDEVGIGAERRLQLRKFSKGMLQRVGIAQAIINDPEVVFFDEPMSGLDPLGRREIRELILRLRSRGCTVFFSSHVLSDAEALCSRVAILASGRLAAAGELSDILALHARGWELVMADLDDTVLEAATASGHVARVTPLGARRYALELPLSVAPDRLVAEFVSQGATLVSVNPIRETLEDFYMRQIGAVPHERGLATG